MPLYTLYELLIYIFWLSFAKALLLHRDIQPFAEYAVAPLVGAWIETLNSEQSSLLYHVAPLVGAWIETHSGCKDMLFSPVAPLVGAWIETLLKRPLIFTSAGRTPRGCVD